MGATAIKPPPGYVLDEPDIPDPPEGFVTEGEFDAEQMPEELAGQADKVRNSLYYSKQFGLKPETAYDMEPQLNQQVFGTEKLSSNPAKLFYESFKQSLADKPAMMLKGAEVYTPGRALGMDSLLDKSSTFLRSIQDPETKEQLQQVASGKLWPTGDDKRWWQVEARYLPEVINSWAVNVADQIPIMLTTMAGRVAGKAIGKPLGAAAGVATALITGGPDPSDVATAPPVAAITSEVIKHLGGAAPLVAMEAGNFMDEADNLQLDRDISEKYAKGYGLGSGAIEYAQWLWVLGRYSKIGKPIQKTIMKEVLTHIGGSMFEGIEEISQQGLQNYLLQKAVAEMKERHPEYEGQAPSITEGMKRSGQIGTGVAFITGMPGTGMTITQGALARRQQIKPETKKLLGEPSVAEVEQAIEAQAERHMKAIGKEGEIAQEPSKPKEAPIVPEKKEIVAPAAAEAPKPRTMAEALEMGRKAAHRVVKMTPEEMAEAEELRAKMSDILEIEPEKAQAALDVVTKEIDLETKVASGILTREEADNIKQAFRGLVQKRIQEPRKQALPVVSREVKPTEAPAEPSAKAPEAKEPPAKKLQAEIEAREIEETDEQLSGITKARRRTLIKQTQKAITSDPVYQVVLDAVGQEIDKFAYPSITVGKGFAGEVTEAIQNHPVLKGRISEAEGLAGKHWDEAVTEVGQPDMDIGEFLDRMGTALEARQGRRVLSEEAMDRAVESGQPFIEMLVEKNRMLRRGMSDLQINQMITEWAERYDIPIEQVGDEFINPQKMKDLEKITDPELLDAEFERIATEQILAEEQMEAQQAARGVLEANDIVAEVVPVAEIERRGVSTALFGREILAPITAKTPELGIGKGILAKATYKDELLQAIATRLSTEALVDTSPRAMLSWLETQPNWTDLFNNYNKPQPELEAAIDDALKGREIPFERQAGTATGAAITQGEREVILLAYGADSRTGYHEGYHLIRPRLTAGDVAILEQAFPDEEAEASAFGEYMQTGKAATLIQRVFAKLRVILDKIRSALQGRGFRTAGDIFGQIRTGKVRKTTTRAGAPAVSFEIQEPGDIFFSKLERAVGEKMPAKMDAGAFKGWIAKQGIRADETKWTGIDDLIKAGKPVTKQQVLDTIRENDVRIEEVLRSGLAGPGRRNLHDMEVEAIARRTQQDRMRDDILIAFEKLPSQTKDRFLEISNLTAYGPGSAAQAAVGTPGATRQESETARDDLAKIMPELNWQAVEDLSTKYYDLADEREEARREIQGREALFEDPRLLLPGWQNYREVLLTMPGETMPEGYKVEERADGFHVINQHGSDLGRWPTRETAERSQSRHPDSPAYRSPHWRETNVLAHIRLTDRWTKGERRVLFVEEIQSDWHQTGRREGYREKIDTTGWTAEKGPHPAWPSGPDPWIINNSQGVRIRAVSSLDANTPAQAIGLALIHEKTFGEGTQAVPDAPFKKTWHELAFKRVLRYAAEEGYNTVAWTTGEQQAERYDLSKQVESIDYIKDKDGTYRIAARLPLGTVGFERTGLNEDQIAEIVGKDVAKRIAQHKGRDTSEGWPDAIFAGTLSGLDLKVGGEMHKLLYDKKIPAFAAKYAKKWGVKGVGEAKIGTEKGIGDEVTDEMLFKASKRARAAGDTVAAEALKVMGQQTRNTGEVSGAVYNPNPWPGAKRPPSEYVQELRTFGDVYEDVHAIPVTAAMKQSVMAGQVKYETSGERFRRETERKARIKARKARLIAQRGGKKKKGPKIKRIKIKIHDVTPGLEPGLAPRRTRQLEMARRPVPKTGAVTPPLAEGMVPAPLPPAQERPLTTRTPTKHVFSEQWFEKNLPKEARSIRDRASFEAKRAWRGMEKRFMPLSTRLFNIAPALFRSARRFVYDTMTRTTEMTHDISPFRDGVKKMNSTDWRMLDLALKNGVDWKIGQIVDKYKLTNQYAQAKATLDEIYDAVKEVGIEIEYRRGYWPRVLKDSEGFLMYFQGRDDWSIIEQAIKKRAEQAGRKLEDLTVDEKAQVVNTLLRGYRTQGLTLSRPGFAKERTVEEVGREIDVFYDDSMTAIGKYIHTMNAKIAEREFFGRETREIQQLRKIQSARLTRLMKLKRRVGLKAAPEPKYKEHISKTAEDYKAGQERLQRLKARPLTETIGGYVMQLQAAGEIQASQEKEIQDILKAMFDPTQMGKYTALGMKGIYLDTLNSPLQALTQLDEYAYSFYRSPIHAVPAAIRTVLRQSRITPADIGIVSIGQEFQDLSASRALAVMLKATGFEEIDRLNKENYINTVLAKYEALAGRTTPNPAFLSRLKRVFGKDYQSVLNDLQNRELSEDVKYLLFNELLDIQPVAITEMPESYRRAGNWRIFYALKSFYLKRLDVVRREAFTDMKSKSTFAQGFGKLVWLAAAFALMGVPSDWLKDFIKGKDFDLSDSVVDSLLKIGMFSRYQAWRTREKGLGRAVLESWTIPTKSVDAISKDFYNTLKGKDRGFELWRSVPVVGEEYYWWFGEGARKNRGGGMVDVGGF